MADPSRYISTTGRRMTAPSNSRPLASAAQKFDQSDEFLKIQQKAQAASKFYNTLILSNGDLPRNKGQRSDVKRRSMESPDAVHARANSKRSTWTQPQSPVAPSPSKYGMWIKPRNKSDDPSLSQTLPSSSKRLAEARNQSSDTPKSRSKSSSSNDTFISHVSMSPTLESITQAENGAFKRPEDVVVRSNSASQYAFTDEQNCKTASLNRSGRLNYSGRDFDTDINSHTTAQLDQNNQVNPNLVVKKETGKNKEILYAVTLPIPKNMHSISPPVDIQKSSKSRNRSFDSIDKNLSGSYDNLEKFSEMLDGKKSDSYSNEEPWTDLKSEVLSSSYDGAIDRKGIKETQKYRSASSLDHVSDADYQRSDPRADPQKSANIKKVNSDSISSSHIGSSPKNHRRFNKDKIRSKSDVPDHKVLLNRVPGIYNQGMDEVDGYRRPDLEDDRHKRRHHFAHYDWQSMLFSFKDVLLAMDALKRKNTTTGASKASALVAAVSTESLTKGSSSLDGSVEDLSFFEDEGLYSSGFNDLVQLCPFFRNEIGGEREQVVCISSSGTNTSHHFTVSVQLGKDGEAIQARNVLTNHTYLSVCESVNKKSALPPGSPPSGSVTFGIEHVDEGAYYYRNYFFEKDHQNYSGIDEKYGPIVISIRREKVEEEGIGAAYQHRIILRTCELCTLRGLVLDEAIHVGTKHGSKNPMSAKEVFEQICPEVSLPCLRLSPNTAKFQEQLMKVDEQNVFKKYKIGVLYCKADQITEEDMYNNEFGSPAFTEFLEILGDKIKLNGFTDFRGGLDIKTDSTGTESYFTTFKDYKIMFHISTMLPFTPNNRQQLLRKRHIGNDIATVVFQEPGSKPFTPKHIRSHFQHVFIIVRLVPDPDTGKTCYRVSVARERNIPKFGPSIPENCMFPKSLTFREFLLTKIINGENVAHAAGKFKSMAMNTRQEYLRDIAKNQVTQTGMEGNPKFGRFSISAASRRIRENKEKKAKPSIFNSGALTWHVSVDDYSTSGLLQCIMGVSHCVLTLIDIGSRQLIFSIPCQAVIGWTVPPPVGLCKDLHIYYGRGERLTVHSDEAEAREEIIIRLERFTKGCETIYRQLRRNPKGELGFHVNYEGIVMEVEPKGYAAMDGLKQSSRLVEICKVAVATMSHEEIIDLLRTSEHVKVVVIPPNEDMTPRKCSMELYHLYPVLEVKKAKPLIVEHERSQSEPVPPNHERHILHSTQSNLETAAKNNMNANYHTGSLEKIKKHRNTSSVDLKATHIGSQSTKRAVVGSTQAFQKKNISPNHSSATNTLSSTRSTNSSNLSSQSGHDVDWSKLSEDNLNQSISSSSTLNSNNNSNSLNRSSSNNTPTAHSRSQMNGLHSNSWATPISGHFLNENKNNSNSSQNKKKSRRENPIKEVNWSQRTPKKSHSYSVECTPNLEVNQSLRVYTPGTEEYKTLQIDKLNTPTLHETTRSKPSAHSQSYSYDSNVNLPTKWRPAALLPNKQNLSLNLKNNHRNESGKRVKKNNLSSPSTLTPKSSDVQISLIKLLTNESPTKKPVPKKRTSHPRKSPTRPGAQHLSPKRRLSPTFGEPVRSPFNHHPLVRAMSDESLCGARADDVILARHSSAEMLDHDYYDSYSSIRRTNRVSPRMIPLPAEDSSWDRILDAAKAAETFEATSMRSASIGTLNELGEMGNFDHDRNGRARKTKRTFSMEQLYDHEFRGNQGDPTSLLRKREPASAVASHSAVNMTSQTSSNRHNESEQRLEKIESELRMLQEKLRKERESKKFLLEEVSTLRRDNTRLRHMKHHNGFSKGSKQSKS